MYNWSSHSNAGGYQLTGATNQLLLVSAKIVVVVFMVALCKPAKHLVCTISASQLHRNVNDDDIVARAWADLILSKARRRTSITEW